jgi:serine/threonine protein kinase
MSTHPPTLSKPSVPSSGTDHDALPPGTRFGEFEILRVLGVGGFGIVYLARDHSLEREVALKEYMPASLAARGAGPQITVRSSSFAETYAIGLRSFINEARLLARFDHPSLVKVYRFWEDNATAYMVMPFLQGVTLRDTRRGMAHAPDEAWIKSVLTPILSALELLHREGVYHRDIAPDNILLPRDGPPVLLDFGAARRVISDRTQSLTAILKPSYAPIEQYAEMTQLRQGPWTDIYALGAVVHFLLFGVPPAPATARAVQDDGEAIETRIVPGVSPRFLEAMSWMLAIRPANRPQSGEQLRAVLDGRAEIPPRGRPGMTIPGALSPVAGPQIEQAADATRINTAYLPTHMPTARVVPASEVKTTTFSPTAPMPTARATATDLSPARGNDRGAASTQRNAGASASAAEAAAAKSPTRAAATSPTQAPAAGPPAAAASAAKPGAAAAPAKAPVVAATALRPAASEAPAAKPVAPGSPANAASAGIAPSAPGRPSDTVGSSAPVSSPRSGPASVPAALASTPPARGGADSAAAPLTATPPARPSHGREGPPSQPAAWAASRPPASSGSQSRPAALAPPLSGPAPFAANANVTPARRGASSKTWLVAAGGGLFVAIAAVAAWQFSARDTAGASAPAGSASAPAPNDIGAAPVPEAKRGSNAPIIVETPEPPTTTSTLPPQPATPPKEPAVSTPPASITGDEAAAKASSAGKAPMVDLSASAPRVRPAGKPVPRVGDDPALAANGGLGPNRPPEPQNPGVPSANGNGGDRSKPAAPAPSTRDYPMPQPPPATAEPGPLSIGDVCKGSWLERNVCMDERCEEARFRSTPTCVDVLNRKRKRGQF